MSRYNREVVPFLRKTLNKRTFKRDDVLELRTECGEHIGFITNFVTPIIQKYQNYFQIEPGIVVLRGGTFDQRTENMLKFGNDFKLKWPTLAPELGFTMRQLGWRNELYAVYPKNQHPLNFKTELFHIERGLCKFLGIETFGVHVNCFTKKSDGIYIWIGRRSPTKTTFPNMIDQCVAGQ